jgi:hypothetical protein
VTVPLTGAQEAPDSGLWTAYSSAARGPLALNSV